MSGRKVYESPAARTRAYRARQQKAGLRRVEVRLDAQTFEGLDRLCPDFGVASVGQVIESLVTRMLEAFVNMNAGIEDLFDVAGDVSGDDCLGDEDHD